jgi:delta-aminolevulinic acid dehydratase/porphobilinogen synthase
VLVILQENIDTVTVGRVDNVGEEDCIKIKPEADYIQLVRTIKTEEEVSVVCWSVLW